jgi:hypothetical protein
LTVSFPAAKSGVSADSSRGFADEVRTAMVTRAKVHVRGRSRNGALRPIVGCLSRLAPIEGHHGRWSSIRSRSSRAGGQSVTPQRPHVLRTRLALASLGSESARFQSVLRPVAGGRGHFVAADMEWSYGV